MKDLLVMRDISLINLELKLQFEHNKKYLSLLDVLCKAELVITTFDSRSAIHS